MSAEEQTYDERRHVIVGTAGHIDHGKTALVKALTGTDADRLEEEKRRGITIELGFVFMEAEGLDRQVVFIDVPGHDKLIRTMVAGSANLDAAMLVVAADEGVSAQTREHFDILRLLQVPRGTVALTKVDLVDEDLLELARADVAQLVEGTFLEDAPVVPVSAITGEGVEDVRSALASMAAEVPPRTDSGILRIPIDRAFTMHGFGTVIAGTILSGDVSVGEELEIYPLGVTGKVRGIQVHNAPQEHSVIGRRTAINIPDVDKDAIHRGHWAGRPGKLTPTWRVDGRITLLGRAPEALKNGARVRVHIGTGEILARVALLDVAELAPGEGALAQLVLEDTTVALPGDRFVIRSLTPVLTIGGGVILDAHPERHSRFDEETLEALEQLEAGRTEAVEQVFAGGGAVAQGIAEVAVRLGEDEESIEQAVQELLAEERLVAMGGTPERYIHVSAYAALRERARAALDEFFAGQPHRLLMPEADLRSRLGGREERAAVERVIDDLVAEGALFRRGPAIGISGRDPQLSERQQRAAEAIERTYLDAGLASPREEELRERMQAPAEAFEQVIVALIEQGKLVRIADNVTYHAAALAEAEEVLREYLGKHDSVEVADFRDHLGVSRKYALALLEHFDRAGVTRRRGDERVLAE
jgi:selenocysteine-specific elongation factor